MDNLYSKDNRSYLHCKDCNRFFSTPTYKMVHLLKEHCPECGGKLIPVSKEEGIKFMMD